MTGTVGPRPAAEEWRWRARQDSNLRPSAPEADALSTELQARGRRSYPVSVVDLGFRFYALRKRRCTHDAGLHGLAERKTLRNRRRRCSPPPQ